MQAQVATKSGEKWSLAGFMAVNRAKLKAIPADKFAELAKTDELELLYLHLQSMRNFSGLPNRLAIVQNEKPSRDQEATPGHDENGGGSGRAATH
jgi:hypothetical protein